MNVQLDLARPSPVEATALYDSVGWSSYTSDPGTLAAAIAHSPYVLTARIDRRLVGMLRAVGDGHTILFVQDVLVAPEMQRRRIGTALIQRCLADHPDVRQVVLMADDEPGLVAFYRRLGFHQMGVDAPLIGFVHLRR